jgi:DNA-binding CsgD family transcriptional regulator
MLNNQEKITNQESKILHLISQLKTNSEIGELLFISPNTVKNHKANIKRKLNLKSSRDLLIYSLQNSSHSIVLESQKEQISKK